MWHRPTNWMCFKKMIWERLTQFRVFVHFPLIQMGVSVVFMLTSRTHSTKRISVTIQIRQKYPLNPIPGNDMFADAKKANVFLTAFSEILIEGPWGLLFQSLKSSTLVIVASSVISGHNKPCYNEFSLTFHTKNILLENAFWNVVCKMALI